MNYSEFLNVDILARFYYICCRSGMYKGNLKPRKISEKRRYQKETRKLNCTCISRVYVDQLQSGKVGVCYVSAHIGHELSPQELRYLPLPKSTKEEVSLKMIMGVPAQNILQGVLWNLFYYLLYEVYILDVRENIGDRENRESFDQTVSFYIYIQTFYIQTDRHFISRADVNNVRVKVQHNLVQRHKDDATSVSLFISELQHESFSPVVVFKPQGEKHPKYSNISKETFVLVIQTKFQLKLYKKHAPTIMCIDSTH